MTLICYCMDRHPSYAVAGASLQASLIAREIAARHGFEAAFTCRAPGPLHASQTPGRDGPVRLWYYEEDLSLPREARRRRFDGAYPDLLRRIRPDICHTRATIPNLPAQ